MADPDRLGFETLAVHAGVRPDPRTGASNVPVYLSSSYVFDDADHAASLFNLEIPGHIYSRISNPTVAGSRSTSASSVGRSRCVPSAAAVMGMVTWQRNWSP